MHVSENFDHRLPFFFLENLLYLKKLVHQMNDPVEKGVDAA